MSSTFHSFQRTSLGAFVQSPLGVRNGGGNLVVGGNFLNADGNTVYRVCVLKSPDLVEIFDPPDSAVNSNVFDVIEYQGKLHICGNFDEGIRVHNKSDKSFDVIGGGLNEGAGHGIGDCMTLWNGYLVVAGQFSDAGGVANTDEIAAWDGSNFISLNTSNLTFLFGISDIDVYDGELYAVGSFRFNADFSKYVMAKYDGSSWSVAADVPVGFGFFRDLAVQGGSLWAGSSGGILEYPSLNQTTSTGIIYVLDTFKGNLVAGGDITVIDGVTVQSVAMKDSDGVWNPVGDGLGGAATVQDIFEYKGEMYIVGNFFKFVNGSWRSNILKLDEKNDVWTNASDGGGLSDIAYCMTEVKGL